MELHTPRRIYILRAANDVERRDWSNALTAVIGDEYCVITLADSNDETET